MGNNTSTKLRSVGTKKGGTMQSFQVASYIAYTLYAGSRLDEIRNAKGVGQDIILIGKHENAKEKVFEYFVSLDEKKGVCPGFIKKKKQFFGYFNLTITSIEGFTDGLNTQVQMSKATLLICHPTTKKQFTEEKQDITDFLSLTNQEPKDRLVVLTECICPYKDHKNCRIPVDIQDMCTDEPILFRIDGKAFGYRLFFLKFPRHLLADVALDIISISTPLFSLSSRVICSSMKFVRQAWKV